MKRFDLLEIGSDRLCRIPEVDGPLGSARAGTRMARLREANGHPL
jgi:hypothetical protein